MEEGLVDFVAQNVYVVSASEANDLEEGGKGNEGTGRILGVAVWELKSVDDETRISQTRMEVLDDYKSCIRSY